MLVGATITLTDLSVDPATVARLVEERGLESLFVTEHTHIPAALGAHFPRDRYPELYVRMRTLDPIVALTAAAAATGELRLGTSIMLAAQHEPIVTAKALATLDLLSGGRVELGVGAGWIEPELANHGVAYDRRFGHLREHVEAMRAIWSDEVASYRGEHVRFEEIWSWPKPVQRVRRRRARDGGGDGGCGPDGGTSGTPSHEAKDGDGGETGGIPVLIGGDGARVLDRVLRYGDGWLPRSPGGLDELAPRVRELHARCDAAGRPRLPVTAYNVPLDPASLDAHDDLGVYRALVRLPSAEMGEVERALDEAAAALERAGRSAR